MLIEPRNFSALLGTLRGISDRALSSHLAIYRQAVDRLNAIEQAFPLVEWKAAGSPDVGDAITAALLAAPVAKLNLRPVGPLAECLAQVEADLEARGIAFRPAWYLGVADDDFWTVDRAISVNIPWCFANPSLWRLANRSRFTAYTPDQMLRTLRHEAGHALLYGFELWRRPDWQNVFGDSRQPYVERYDPTEGSRDFVEYTTYVRAHYGQKHPDEDWAESFACWLDPVTNWRQQYQDWPLALWKLEYVDALARGGQFAGATPNPYLGKRAPYQQTRGTVAETLGVGTSAPSTGLHGTWSEHASLLEAEPAAYNDVLLHEAHFGALVGGSSSPPESLVAAVAANWGSWDSYLLDLRLACAASRGWVLTLWDERRGQVRNALVQPGGAVPVGCQVLLALDCETHAYALDFGAAKHLGVAAEFENVDWRAVAERLLLHMQVAVAVTQDFGVDPSAVILPAAGDEGETDDDHRNAGREGLIAVERDVTRGEKTFKQTYWIRPEEKQATDRQLAPSEAKEAMDAPRVFKSGTPRDATAAEKYCAEKAKKWVKSLDKDERSALKDYSMSEYRTINEELRFEKMGEATKDYVKNIDSALARAKLPEPLVVHRAGWAAAEKLIPGGRFSDKAYVSTTLLENITHDFIPVASMADAWRAKGVAPVQWHIRLPAGAHAAIPDGVSNSPHEAEVLLPRGSSFRIESVTRANVRGTDMTIVEAVLETA